MIQYRKTLNIPNIFRNYNGNSLKSLNKIINQFQWILFVKLEDNTGTFQTWKTYSISSTISSCRSIRWFRRFSWYWSDDRECWRRSCIGCFSTFGSQSSRISWCANKIRNGGIIGWLEPKRKCSSIVHKMSIKVSKYLFTLIHRFYLFSIKQLFLFVFLCAQETVVLREICSF